MRTSIFLATAISAIIASQRTTRSACLSTDPFRRWQVILQSGHPNFLVRSSTA